MKAFTVTAHSVVAGLRVINDDPKVPYVAMGRTGEHESAMWLHLSPGKWPYHVPQTIRECSIEFRPSKKEGRDLPNLYITPPDDRDPPNDAIVLVDIRGNPKGVSTWSTARVHDIPCPLRGNLIGEVGICNVCGVQGDPHTTHPHRGSFQGYGQFPTPGVHIIKKSHIRYSDSHPDPSCAGLRNAPWMTMYLLRMQPRSIFRVHRGYDKGVANERLIRWDGEHLELGTAAELLEKYEIREDHTPSEEAVDQLFEMRQAVH